MRKEPAASSDVPSSPRLGAWRQSLRKARKLHAEEYREAWLKIRLRDVRVRNVKPRWRESPAVEIFKQWGRPSFDLVWLYSGLAQEIKKHINQQLPVQIDGFNVSFDGTTAKLFGQAKTQMAREKAVLLAGNHDGVDRVDDGRTVVAQTTAQQVAATQQAQAAAPQQATFYQIKSGDSLSKIAKEKYGDANAWHDLFEANREVIGDPDKIYPGQTIRIPARA